MNSDSSPLDRHKIASSRRARVPPIFVAVLLLIPIGIFNRFIFVDTNLPILAILMFGTAVYLSGGRVPRKFFLGISAAFALMVMYAWARLDEPLGFDFALRFGADSGLASIVDMILFYVMILSAALAWARTGRLSKTLWLLACGYIAAYMLRNSGDIQGLQDGYNLSPGFVVCSLLPLAFLVPNSDGPRAGPIVLAVAAMLWLAMIGSRTAMASILVFLGCLYLWPWITRNRWTFVLSFLAMLLAIVVLHALYLTFATSEPDSLVSGSSVGIFQKRIGTRIEIWLHLSYLILQAPWFGYGTDQTTLGVAPLMLMEFTINRNNLGSHSIYFELLYRLGIVGLGSFLLIMFALWNSYWAGRTQWAVRVAGSFLVSALIFGATSEYLFFSAMRLESGFAWIALGIGVGASLRFERATHADAAIDRPSFRLQHEGEA